MYPACNTVQGQIYIYFPFFQSSFKLGHVNNQSAGETFCVKQGKPTIFYCTQPKVLRTSPHKAYETPTTSQDCASLTGEGHLIGRDVTLSMFKMKRYDALG